MRKEEVLKLCRLVELCEIESTYKYRPLYTDLVSWSGLSPDSFTTKEEAITHFVNNLPKLYTHDVRIDYENINVIKLKPVRNTCGTAYNGHRYLKCRKRIYKVLLK
jgi:hypothetical protein